MGGLLTIIFAAVIIGGGILFFSDLDRALPQANNNDEVESVFAVTDELIESIERAGYEVSVKDSEKSSAVQEAEFSLPPLPSGAYRANASYTTPARKTHTLTAEVGLDDDIVTNLTLYIDGVKNGFVNPFQENFAAEIEPLVIGKNIDSLTLETVADAAQETTAFNDALEQIRAERAAE